MQPLSSCNHSCILSWWLCLNVIASENTLESAQAIKLSDTIVNHELIATTRMEPLVRCGRIDIGNGMYVNTGIIPFTSMKLPTTGLITSAP